VTAPSLLAQEDQSFEWAVLVNDHLPEQARTALEQALAPFEGRAFVHVHKGRIVTSLLDLASKRALVDRDGRILTGRIDDDDAWAKETVGEVRKRVARHASHGDGTAGFGLTFEDGLLWVMYDLANADDDGPARRKATVSDYRCPFHSMSGFVYSPLEEGLTAYSHKHSGIPDLLRQRGYAVAFVATEEPMWLYCRHKQTTSAVGRAKAAEPMEVDTGELARRFGIAEERTTRYIADAGAYGHIRFNPLKRMAAYRRGLDQLGREIEAAEPGGSRVAQLTERKRCHAQRNQS
jgi:hypothetical protein